MPFVANRNIETKNLKVKEGQILPTNWQAKTLITYLRQQYGFEVVKFVDEDSLVGERNGHKKRRAKVRSKGG